MSRCTAFASATRRTVAGVITFPAIIVHGVIAHIEHLLVSQTLPFLLLYLIPVSRELPKDIVVILIIAVIPLMYYQVKHFKAEEAA